MTTATGVIVQTFADALRAERYKIQVHHPQTEDAFWVEYTAEQLLRSVSYLRYKNGQGFNIYIRPIGWQYVLLDDLTRSSLTALASLQPCLLIETSPANYQAWLILSELPPDRANALANCRQLAEQLGGDLASAEPEHVGRLPGFTNRKEKHRQSNGYYPFVRLCKAHYRLSTFYPSGGGACRKRMYQYRRCLLLFMLPSSIVKANMILGLSAV